MFLFKIAYLAKCALDRYWDIVYFTDDKVTHGTEGISKQLFDIHSSDCDYMLRHKCIEVGQCILMQNFTYVFKCVFYIVVKCHGCCTHPSDYGSRWLMG